MSAAVYDLRFGFFFFAFATLFLLEKAIGGHNTLGPIIKRPGRAVHGPKSIS